LALLAGIVLFIYLMWPWVGCVYDVADAYKLGEGVEVDERIEAVREAYDAERQEMARQAANAGSYLAAVQFGAKECWGVVGFGYGRPAVLTHVMIGCFGVYVLLLLYGRFHRPRWKKDLYRTRREVDRRMSTDRRYARPRFRSDEPPTRPRGPRAPPPRPSSRDDGDERG
jgi:hypothetical protein